MYLILVSNPFMDSIPACAAQSHSMRCQKPQSFRPPLKVSYALNLNIQKEDLSSGNRMTKRRCECFDLHSEQVPYAKAWSWQKSIVNNRKDLVERGDDSSDTVIILQHPPVYTLGTGSSEEFLNFEVKDAPVDIYKTERGGQVTYHGPGQLVMYPIINLRHHKMDLHWYLRALEEVVIRALSSAFAINASRFEGYTGVWVGDQKVAAIGVRVSKWIAYHGLALNVTTDLTPFQKIVPCGIRDFGVGSIKDILIEGASAAMSEDGGDLELIDVAFRSLLKEFCDVFQLELSHKLPPLLESS